MVPGNSSRLLRGPSTGKKIGKLMEPPFGLEWDRLIALGFAAFFAYAWLLGHNDWVRREYRKKLGRIMKTKYTWCEPCKKKMPHIQHNTTNGICSICGSYNYDCFTKDGKAIGEGIGAGKDKTPPESFDQSKMEN